jgi:hypothetical protein
MDIHEFTVETVGPDIATVTPDLVLQEDKTVDETPLTRTVFRAEVRSQGVRGWLIQQKRNRNEEWEDTKKIDFRKLKSGEGANIELSTEALSRVVEQYEILKSHIAQHGLSYGKQSYISGKKDEILIVNSKSVAASIASILKKQPDEEFWAALAADQPGLLRRLAYGAQQEVRRRQLRIFEYFLDDPVNLQKYATAQKLTDAKDEKIWQHYFEQNPWIFGYGLDYQYLNVLQREATIGSPTVGGTDQELIDFLMGTSEYTVLVEIKTAETPLMAATKNRSNSWRLSNELIHAQSQILEQRASFQAYVDANHDSLYTKDGDRVHQNTLNPRVILVIGRTSALAEAGSAKEQDIKKRTFELYRRELHSITVLTYDELLERARHIVATTKEPSKA